MLDAGHFPVVLGGGHEIAYGTYLGVAGSRRATAAGRIGILNLDAHFDLRADAVPSSGTPFRQILEADGDIVRYAVLGISQPSNTTALFDTAAKYNVRYLLDDDCEQERALAFVDDFVADIDLLYLTIDLDVLPAAVAPGVSAPAAFGIPLSTIQAVCDRVTACGKLAVVDVAELNPGLDIDNRTARTAARLIHRIVTGHVPSCTRRMTIRSDHGGFHPNRVRRPPAAAATIAGDGPDPRSTPPMALDYSDRTDFDNADRGFIATLDPMVIRNAAGDPVFDLTGYSYLDGECPDTVHPSLFRQAQLVRKNGLYEVTEGIYQIRGFDLSNMTLVEGRTGVIVIDPLISAECAAAGLALYREHRGDRPVTGVIYTHSHGDHFGGVEGVLPDGRGDVPILAPEGFMAEAVSENVYAGNAMNRRGTYMYGYALPISAEGQVSTGLGIRGSSGTIGLIPPTVDITHTGQQETVDGVPIVFQVTPGTEAPAEMNFHFPQHRALCMAENATHNLHNLLTLRGAQIRDAQAWSHYIDEAIELFSGDTDVAFASHHWPTWGRENVVDFLTVQRDLYMYLHDQTLRLLNNGLTGPEIAEQIELPPGLADAWCARGYYGSVSHNVKAIYQRYLGWFDGHPGSLWPHPRQARATRYAEAFGGIDVLVAKGKEYADKGDLRFAAELLEHAVFAAPDDAAARRRWPRSSPGSATAPRTRPGAASTSPAPMSCATAWCPPR